MKTRYILATIKDVYDIDSEKNGCQLIIISLIYMMMALFGRFKTLMMYHIM